MKEWKSSQPRGSATVLAYGHCHWPGKKQETQISPKLAGKTVLLCFNMKKWKEKFQHVWKLGKKKPNSNRNPKLTLSPILILTPPDHSLNPCPTPKPSLALNPNPNPNTKPNPNRKPNPRVVFNGGDSVAGQRESIRWKNLQAQQGQTQQAHSSPLILINHIPLSVMQNRRTYTVWWECIAHKGAHMETSAGVLQVRANASTRL